MRKLRPWLLGLFGGMLLSTQVMGGTWTANEFFYKPDVGARGGGEKARYDSGLDRIDARLGKTVWVGDPNYGTTLQSAITAIGANNVILRVPTGTYDIATNLTIPANVSLRPERGAVLSIATGVTLTINGALDAGPYQIFSCTGTGKVVFNVGTAKEIYPEWWLTNIPPGTIDMSAALQAAFNAAKACKIPVLLSNTYLINTGISLTSGWTNLRIINRGIIKAGAAIQMIDLDGVGWYGQLELQLDGNHIATGGLRIGASQTSASSSGWSYKPWDITIYNVNGDGFAANWCENVAFTNIDINYCNGSGLKPRNCQQWVFTKAWLLKNDG